MDADEDLTSSTDPASAGPAKPRSRRLVIPLLALTAMLAALAAFWALNGLGRTPQTAVPAGVVDLSGSATASPFQGFTMSPVRPAPDFELIDQHGQPWRLADQRGKTVALFFGYTHCPDVCPQTMNILARAMDELGPQAEDVEVVLVTVDPERDTPEVLGQYVAGFHPAFVGLYGEDARIKEIADAYGVRFVQELPPAKVTEAAALAAEHGPGVSAGSSGSGEHAGTAEPGESTPAPGALESTDDHADEVSVDLEPGSAAYTVGHSSAVFLIDPQGQLRASFMGIFSPEEVAHDVRFLLDERG